MPDYQLYSDTELIAACQQGHEQAWAALVQRYERLVYTIPLRYGLSAAEAEDVFQSVWLSLLTHLQTIRQPERIAAWLVTTARRECWEHRRQAKYKRTDLEDLEQLPENSWVDTLSPEDIVARFESNLQLRQAFAKLQERCRQLLWHLYYNLSQPSYADIARQLDMSEGAIGPTRARCLQKLRELLKQT